MYSLFILWCETKGLEFPCTEEQFIARATEFAKGDTALVDKLCERGLPR